MAVLDEKGDREPDYWITDMAPNGTFIKIAEVLNTDDGGRVSKEYIKHYFLLSHFVIHVRHDDMWLRDSCVIRCVHANLVSCPDCFGTRGLWATKNYIFSYLLH